MYRQAYIELRINHFAELVRTASSFEAKQRAMVKMLEWKRKRTIETVQRLEDERLAQVQASATIARGVK